MKPSSSKESRKQMTEWEVEELVRQQTKEFRKEIEKRYAVSKHNLVFKFPYECDLYETSDSSIMSLEHTEVYNLHYQNNIFGMRKKSMSEKLIRPFQEVVCDSVKPHEQKEKPKSQEKYTKPETSVERLILTNRPVINQLQLAPSNKKPTKSEHQSGSPIPTHSQRHQPVICKQQPEKQNKPLQSITKLNNITNYTNDITQTQTCKNTTANTTLSGNPFLSHQKISNEINKSTQMIQQKIQKLIQDTKVSERTSNTSSLHQQTNQTLLKLLQKNGMIREGNEQNFNLEISNLKKATVNKAIPIRQIKSPSYNPQGSKSYFSKHHTQMNQLATNISGQQLDNSTSIHRTFTQHDSNNTSRSYISGCTNFQQLLNAQNKNSHQKYTCNTSRLGQQKSEGRLTNKQEINTSTFYINDRAKILKETNQIASPLVQNKSLQEKPFAIPTDNHPKQYIQVDSFLNLTRNYQTNTSLHQKTTPNDRIKDHMIKIGCITGRHTERQNFGHFKGTKYQPTDTSIYKVSNYSMGY